MSLSLAFFFSNPIKNQPLFLSSLRFSFRFLLPNSLRSHSADSFWRSFSSSTPMAAIHSNVDNEVGLARRFWNKFHRESVFALYNPFSVCLASGNLSIESFRHYIAQDVYFLKTFAKAYELAEECADDDDARLIIVDLRKAVLEELKMHNSFVQEWGLDVEKENAINPATIKYTDFLLATASGKVEGVKGLVKLATPFERTKIAAYTIGAMTPCMKLYAHLGKEFHAFLEPDNDSHPYKKWICNYSCESFQASAMQIEDLLDKLSVSLTGEELDIIEKLYLQALKLETDFFYAQPLVQPTIVPLAREHNPSEECLTIFSDFDLTCTVVDSSAILAEIAIVTAPKPDQNLSENQITRMSSTDLRKMWEVLSGQFTEEYEQCIESIMPPEKVVFNYEVLSTALEKISDFEIRANKRVIESGVLRGLNLDDVKRAGERLGLQDGCASFFQKLVKNENMNVSVHVLSYCWCGDLIRSCFSSGDLSKLNVHANELTYENSISTGEIVTKVESPLDKVEAFNDILRSCINNKRNLTVYIGDSVGDLLCLLEADIGIIIGSSASLRRVGTQFGILFVPLFSGLIRKQKDYNGGSFSNWKGRSGVLYTVSSWAEIHAFILGS